MRGRDLLGGEGENSLQIVAERSCPGGKREKAFQEEKKEGEEGKKRNVHGRFCDSFAHFLSSRAVRRCRKGKGKKGYHRGKKERKKKKGKEKREIEQPMLPLPQLPTPKKEKKKKKMLREEKKKGKKGYIFLTPSPHSAQ